MSPDEIKGIASASLPHAISLLRDWFPLGKQSGKEFAVGNLQGAAGKSLSINLTTGQWRDAATAEKGGDLVSLLAAKEGISQSKAAEVLAARIGLAVSNRQTSVAVADYTALPFAPADAPPPPAHRVYGAANGLWCYRNQSGATVGYVCRFDTPTGKQYAPIAWCRNGTGESWQFKAFGRPRPLYRLDLLADAKDEVILIVEGEKTADAAQRLFPDLIVMSWPGGAQAVNYADWTPLKGKRVVIWPDNDQPGKDAAAKISALVEGSKVVKLPGGLPDGWDLADDVPDGVDLRAMLASVDKPSVPVVTVEMLMAHVHDPNEYRLAGGWLGKGQDNSLLGAPGIGKTSFANALIVHHCSGRTKFMGLDLRGGPLKYLVIGSENSRSRLKNDLIYLSKSFTEKECKLIAQNVVYYLAHEDKDSHGGRLHVDESYKRLSTLVQEAKPDVIVYDTLASLTSGLNLNDDKDMMTAIQQAQGLRLMGNVGCSNLILHHAKPGSEAIKQALDSFEGGSFGRNSRALYGQVRGQWNLVQGDREDRNRLVLAVGKMSDAEAFEPIGLRRGKDGYELDPDFDLSALKDNLNNERGNTEITCTIKDVLTTIKIGFHKSEDVVNSLVKDCMTSPRTAKRRIMEAKQRGYIEATTPRGSYVLTDKGLGYCNNP